MTTRLGLLCSLILIAAVPSPLWSQETPAELGAKTVESAHFAWDQVQDQCKEIKGCEGSFYFLAEAFLLRREVTNTDFPATSQGVGGPIVARLQNLSFNQEPGVRVTGGYRFSPWYSAEATYFGQHEYSDAFVVNDPNGQLFGVLNRFGTAQQPVFPSPPFPPTFGTGNNTTSQTGSYSTRLNNYEFNVVRDLVAFNESGDPAEEPMVKFAFLAGVRYLTLRESFFLGTKGNVIPSAGINDPLARADYLIESENDLFGGQIGLRTDIKIQEKIGIRFEGKYAVLALGAEQVSNVVFVFTQPAPILGNLQASAGDLRTSGLGQLSLAMTYDLTKSIKLRGAYDIMWLNGRALAPDQVDPNVAQANTIRPMLNDRGTTVFYGYSFGAELKF